MAVMVKIFDGVRPDRPSSGFSDRLWDLLMATWAVKHAREPGRRPPAWAVLDQLKEIVDDWGISIVPLVPPVPLIPESLEECSGCSMFLEQMPQFINVLSTVPGSTTGYTRISDFCNWIDHPVVDG